jgi:translation initiation factor 3 subunit F
LNRHKQVHLATSNEPYKKIQIEPVLLFSILDSYMRREKETERVIGTLMGSVEDGVVTINNCFVVPHLEQPLKLGVDVHTNRVKLHCEINHHDRVIGWFSTAYKTDKDTMATNALIREFYFKEMNHLPHEIHQPILLVVDPSFQDNELGIRCYVANPVQLSDRGVLQHHYKPIQHVIHTHHPERILFDRMAQRGEESVSPISDLDTLEKSLESQLVMLERIGRHINAVTKGEVVGDAAVAREIDNTLSLIPDHTSEFETMFSKGLQDVLMVIYLAELTKIHLLISENSMLQ